MSIQIGVALTKFYSGLTYGLHSSALAIKKLLCDHHSLWQEKETAHLTSVEIWHVILYSVGIVQLMINYVIFKRC